MNTPHTFYPTTLLLMVGAMIPGTCASLQAQPVITNQPQSQTNFAGATARFTIGATGAPLLSYQWRSYASINAFTNIPFGTEVTLVLTNVQPTSRRFGVVVTDADGLSVTSSPPVNLTAVLPPSITPAHPTASLFDDVTIYATNGFSKPLSYLWLFNDEPIVGAVTDKLLMTSVHKINIGDYAAVFNYAFGSATSQVATLRLVPFSSVFCFGDCLTDTHIYTPHFPNWNGRFSNGPMWVDVASSNLIFTYLAANNFAASGSATFDVLDQINHFHSTSNISSALFTIWAGPVDFYYHLGSDTFFGPFLQVTNEVEWDRVIAAGVNNLSNAVVRLYAMGGRSFLVPTIDDVSRQPVVIRTHTEETRRGLQAKVTQFNEALVRALGSLNESLPELRMVVPDAGGLITRFIEHPADYGMTLAFPAAAQDPDLLDKSLAGPGSDYVWWDEYGHPTTKGHQALANLFQTALLDARPESLSIAVTGEQAHLQMKKLLRGRDYAVQASSDLMNWHDSQTFTASAGTNQITNPINAESGPTFYRLQWQP